MTIPKEIREALNLRPSQKIFLKKRGDSVVIIPAEDFLDTAKGEV